MRHDWLTVALRQALLDSGGAHMQAQLGGSYIASALTALGA